MGATRMRSATYRAGQSVRGFPRNQSDLPALRIGRESVGSASGAASLILR